MSRYPVCCVPPGVRYMLIWRLVRINLQCQVFARVSLPLALRNMAFTAMSASSRRLLAFTAVAWRTRDDSKSPPDFLSSRYCR